MVFKMLEYILASTNELEWNMIYNFKLKDKKNNFTHEIRLSKYLNVTLSSQMTLHIKLKKKKRKMAQTMNFYFKCSWYAEKMEAWNLW